MVKNTQEQNYDTLIRVIILAVILLAVGQVILYRNIQSVKTMISVTAMELKEGKGVRYDRNGADTMKTITEQLNSGSSKK